MKKNEKRIFLYLMLVGILILIIIDSILIQIQMRNYKEKIQILSVMIEEQEKGVEDIKTAVELLKGMQKSEGEIGRRILKSYGYLSQQENWYSLELKQDIGKIILFSVILFSLYLFSLAFFYKLSILQKHKELKEISKVLEHFQKRNYDLEVEKEYLGNDRIIEQIYQQLEVLREMLLLDNEKLAKEKEETKSLVTDISHQLKTPVTGLKTCFEILQQDNLKIEEREEFQAQCNRQLMGLETLVEALINISRMETGMIQIKKELADILETLVSAVNRVYLKAEGKQISIKFEETEDLCNITILHDVKWVCEAFINILENAIKYSQNGTIIFIRMMKRTSFLRIEIQDQGIGISKGEYHKIFKRFYRGQAPEIEKIEGSGVGLYLTREIIGRHGGSVTVSSRCKEPDKGSTFIIQIPYC